MARKLTGESDYSDLDWNDSIARSKSVKIRQVEHQITILNRNRPSNASTDGAMADDQEYNQIMRGTVFSPSFQVDPSYVPPVFPKTPEQTKFLEAVLKDNFLFADLDDEELRKLVNAMQQENVKEHSVIIQQGDLGDFFYVVQSGRVAFSLVDQGVVGYCQKGGSFGELALLYDCPRAASCIAASPVVELWKVDQKTFRLLVASHSQQQHSSVKKLLNRVTLFRDLGSAAINRFAHLLTPVTWRPEDLIVQKGEEGNIFYIIQEGSVKIHDIGLGQSHFADQILGPGDWFGERALLTGEPRAANVTALTAVTTLAMDRETFEKTLGPLKSLMERQMRGNFLKGLPIFANGKITEEELSQMVDLMQEVCYEQGAKLAEAGLPYQSNLWIIRHGKLRVTHSKTGKVYNLQSGDHFGDKSVGGDPKHLSNHTAVCEEKLTTWILTRQDIESVIGDIDRLGEVSALSGEFKEQISMNDLVKRRVLGQGAFGKVWLVAHVETQAAYALKEISKLKTIESKQVESVIREKELLCLLQHPFILNLVSSFQDEKNLYLLLPVIPGGELFSVLHSQKAKGRGLTNNKAAFYASCVIEALGHFHQRSIAYRDLKLENVLIDEYGYCKIVDLGFAKIVEDKTYTLVGTPEYLSPEIIMSKGHDKSCDYWAFGVLVYELLVGKSPFYRSGSSQIDMFKRIVMVAYEVPIYVDFRAKAMIKKLLTRRQAKRLGNLANGVIDIKRDDWFSGSGIDFRLIRRKEVDAPWVPKVKDAFDASNFDDFSAAEKEDDYEPPLTMEEQELFAHF